MGNQTGISKNVIFYENNLIDGITENVFNNDNQMVYKCFTQIQWRVTLTLRLPMILKIWKFIILQQNSYLRIVMKIETSNFR